MKASPALAARIRSDAARLERLHPDITRCRVVVEEAERHREQGREFSVHVEVRVPGRDAVVSTYRRDSDVYVALSNAFESVRRQFGVSPVRRRRVWHAT
jgi:ribosomal subunit interface protein